MITGTRTGLKQREKNETKLYKSIQDCILG